MSQNHNQMETTAWVSIEALTKYYLPISKRKARKFVALYLTPKRIGNRIYVERQQLERLLSDPDRETLPLYDLEDE